MPDHHTLLLILTKRAEDNFPLQLYLFSTMSVDRLDTIAHGRDEWRCTSPIKIV